ncbi:hypothetical protein QJ054_33580 [Streptomyces sp. AN-3]|uniref:hypothetical protein n=1 Tax=Streptomyces sp. AN-3 TaxID=3044177 RepID=UPI00249AEF41|nr:hypothetical protein [Streptomyces sp. AN-3]MDI3101968.1 hypothetical protein [Streptomyces sp. AN-3]
MLSAPALPALDTLDDYELNRLFIAAGDLLLKRSEAGLPAVILDVLREALAEDNDTRKPLRVAFTTTKWDNGYFWYSDSARVTLSDGKTEEIEQMDLSGADEALTDHVSYLVEPLDSTDRLIVTFDPPSAHTE